MESALVLRRRFRRADTAINQVAPGMFRLLSFRAQALLPVPEVALVLGRFPFNGRTPLPTSNINRDFLKRDFD